MNFKNKKNVPHLINDSVIWESRSVAVVCVFIVIDDNDNEYVLASKRGSGMPDFQGKMNLVCGYLDWDESSYEAVLRETWEESGFDVKKYMKKFKVLNNDLQNPWFVNSVPTKPRQNVTLRHGLVLKMSKNDILPELTTQYNETENESEDPTWIPIKDVYKYDWAFEHDKLIQDYLSLLIYRKLEEKKFSRSDLKKKIKQFITDNNINIDNNILDKNIDKWIKDNL